MYLRKYASYKTYLQELVLPKSKLELGVKSGGDDGCVCVCDLTPLSKVYLHARCT